MNKYLFTITALVLLVAAIVLGIITIIGSSVTVGLWSVVCAISGIYFLIFAKMLGEI